MDEEHGMQKSSEPTEKSETGSVLDSEIFKVPGGADTKLAFTNKRLDILESEIRILKYQNREKEKDLYKQFEKFDQQKEVIDELSKEFEKIAKEKEDQFNKQKDELSGLQDNVEEQKDSLRDMIAKQTFTDKSVKLLNSLIIGTFLAIVLLLAGIVYDIVKDNLYITKIYEIKEDFYSKDEIDNHLKRKLYGSKVDYVEGELQDLKDCLRKGGYKVCF